MATRFSLAHLTALSYSPPELIRVAARTGYDFVSLRIIYMGLPNEPNYDLAANAEMLRETKAALNETGLGLHDIELAKIDDCIDPRKYLPSLQVAAELGCAQVISSVWTPRREIAIDRFRELCDLARPLGIRVNLEFMVFSELRTFADALAFLGEADADNARLLVDTLHFHQARCSVEELDRAPEACFGFVHLCDGAAEIPSTKEGIIHIARSKRLYPGSGGIDIAGIVNRLPELVYSIELPNYIQTEIHGREGHVRRCLESARAYLAEQAR